MQGINMSYLNWRGTLTDLKNEVQKCIVDAIHGSMITLLLFLLLLLLLLLPQKEAGAYVCDVYLLVTDCHCNA